MRLLFASHRIPYPPDKGDKVRSYHFLLRLARHHQVRVAACLDDAADRANLGALEGIAAGAVLHEVRARDKARAALRALAGGLPYSWTRFQPATLRAAVRRWHEESPFDAAFAFSAASFDLAGSLGIPVVLDLCDLDSRKFFAYARSAGGPLRWIYSREARAVERGEARIARAAAGVILVTADEVRGLGEIAPEVRARAVPNGVDLSSWAPPAAPARPGEVVFSGAMDYRANVEGILWFAEAVWPRVRAARPDAHLTVVGSNPTAKVRALASGSIEVTGRVPDIRPYLWRATAAVAPLLTARGVQNKVLEALAAGRPVVGTSAVWKGLPELGDPGPRRADDPESFARSLLEILAAPEREAPRVEELRLRMESAFNWDRSVGVIEELLSEAVAARAERSSVPAR